MEDKGLIQTLSEYGWFVLQALSTAYEYITETTMKELVDYMLPLAPVTSTITQWLLDAMKIGEASILQFVFGTAMMFIIIATVVKWIVGIVT